MSSCRFLAPAAIGLLLCLSGLAALAQPLPEYPDVRLKQLDYENASGEEGVSYFHYDRRGQVSRSVWTLLDRSRFSQGYHLLDAEGHEVEKHRIFNDGLTSTEYYFHDGEGRRVGEVFTRSDGINGEAWYTFGPDGRLQVMHCRNHKGWLTCDITYTYDDGRCVSAAITSGGQPAGAITYTYDAAGHLVGEHWDFGGRWSQTFGLVYEPRPQVVFASPSPLLDTNTRYRVCAENYDWNGELGGPSTYRYTVGGRLAEKVFTRSDGLRTVTSYDFDAKGDLTASHRVYHDGQTADFTYVYDSRGRLTEKKFRRSDGAAGCEEYAYDRLGRLEKATYRNLDFWLNGTVLFRYDAQGRLEMGRFRAEEGHGADLDIACDDHGNVTSVHWRFDFGKQQLYEFSYEPTP